jgi:hypothetical protein
MTELLIRFLSEANIQISIFAYLYVFNRLQMEQFPRCQN